MVIKFQMKLKMVYFILLNTYWKLFTFLNGSDIYFFVSGHYIFSSCNILDEVNVGVLRKTYGFDVNFIFWCK